MATTKKSSTSKTARVMNLLSKNREEPAPELETPVEETQTAPESTSAAETAAPASIEPANAPASVPHSTTPPIISSMQADSVISDQVFSALETALGNELGESAPAPAPVAAAEPAPVPDPEPVSLHDLKPDPALHPPTLYPVNNATIYVNVMEALVEDKAMKYINMFGLCKCPRCIADVKSLALNRLDPKYVVMHTGEVIPRISLYEGKYAAAVTAQLLSACKIVMEHPRHDRT